MKETNIVNVEWTETARLSLLKQAIALRQEKLMGVNVAATVMSLVMFNAAD